MGMYTDIRGKIKVKAEYCKAIDDLVKSKLNWEDSELDFFRKFGETPRAEDLSDDDPILFEHAWDNSVDEFKLSFNWDTRMFTFISSLYDRENVIRKFFDEILSVIAEEVVVLETSYEEDFYYIKYKLGDEGIEIDGYVEED